MPFVDLQSRLGISLDQWILAQSGEQPYKRAARCHAFEKEWIECGHGIGQTRAKKECKLEFEDFYECMHRQKTVSTFKQTFFCKGKKSEGILRIAAMRAGTIMCIQNKNST